MRFPRWQASCSNRAEIISIFLKTSRPEIYEFRVSLGNLFGLVISLWVIGISLGQPAPQANSAAISPRAKLLVMFQRETRKSLQPTKRRRLSRRPRNTRKIFPDLRRSAQSRRRGIQVSGVDPNILGRLVHVRSDWPELTPGGVYYVNGTSARSMRTLFLGVPKTYDRTVAWPLVIKLPTADAFVGTPKANADDVQRIYTNWVSKRSTIIPMRWSSCRCSISMIFGGRVMRG